MKNSGRCVNDNFWGSLQVFSGQGILLGVFVTHPTATSQCLGVLRKDAQITIREENHLHLRK